MSAPLVPSPLYGLRTWTASGEQGDERLAGPRQGTPWPTGGEWLEAECDRSHAAPAPGCDCGIHAWHVELHGARRVLMSWREIPGVVEAEGAVELHEDGFRAERARPYVLFAGPHANMRLVGRLAHAYDVDVVGVDGAEAIVAWCRARGLGLAPDVVGRLLGPEVLEAARHERRARRRIVGIRIAVLLAVIGALVGFGVATTHQPDDCTVFGRTGEVRVC